MDNFTITSNIDNFTITSNINIDLNTLHTFGYTDLEEFSYMISCDIAHHEEKPYNSTEYMTLLTDILSSYTENTENIETISSNKYVDIVKLYDLIIIEKNNNGPVMVIAKLKSEKNLNEIDHNELCNLNNELCNLNNEIPEFIIDLDNNVIKITVDANDEEKIIRALQLFNEIINS
jgi:hypothetical protein